MDFNLLLLDASNLQVEQTAADYIRDTIMLVLTILFFVVYIRDARKRGVTSLHQALTTDSINSYRFIGELSTGLEIVGLIIIAVFVNHSMGLFNATARYFLIGVLELYLTIRFQAVVLEDYANAFNNDKTTTSRSGKVINVTFFEKVWIVVKNIPIFIAGFVATTMIYCFYMESIGALHIVLLEGSGGLIDALTSIRINYSSNSAWAPLQFSGIFLIYMTPILNLFFMMDIIGSSESKIMNMINLNNYQSTKHASGTTGSSSASNPPKTSANASSSGNPPKTSANASSSGNPQTNTNPPSSTSQANQTDLNSFISLKDEIAKMFKIVEDFGGDVSLFGFSADELYKFVCKKCGVNATNKQIEVFTGVTAKEVEDYIASFDVSTGTAQQGKSPVEFYESTLKQLIYGVEPNNVLMGKLLSVYNSYKTVETTIASENMKLQQTKRDMDNTNDQSDKDRLRDEIQNMETIINNLQSKLGTNEETIKNLCQTIPVTLSQKLSGIGMQTS